MILLPGFYTSAGEKRDDFMLADRWCNCQNVMGDFPMPLCLHMTSQFIMTAVCRFEFGVQNWILQSFVMYFLPIFLSSPFFLHASFTWSGCCGLCFWRQPTELAHCFFLNSVLVSIPVFMSLSTVFHSINIPDNSPLSHSVLPVLFLLCWSLQQLYDYLWMKVSFSPDVILCGWLG